MSETSVEKFVARHFRRNYYVGIVNGALFGAGVAFLDPTTVIPTFVGHLTDSSAIIGGVSTIFRAGQLFAQLFVANALETRPLKKPAYVVTGVLRVLSLLGLAVAVGLWGDRNPALSLTVFVVAYALYSIFTGMGMLPFEDVIAKTIYPQNRGSFMAYRHLWGSVLAIGVGGIVARVLGDPARLPYPKNFALLFSFGGLLLLVAIFLFSIGMCEPRQEKIRGKVGMGEYLLGALRMAWGDQAYRNLLIVRLLVGAEALSLPFLVRYATDSLGVGVHYTGTFLAVQMVGGIVSSIGWGKLSDRKGNRLAIRLVCVTGAMVFAWALLSPVLAEVLGSVFAVDKPNIVTRLYAGVFLIVGIFNPGSQLAFGNYLLDVAPEEKRITLMGLANTLSGMQLIVFPALGGLLIDLVSYRMTFALSLLSLLGAYRMSFTMVEPRHRRE